jgi:hypothetical protein
MDTHLYRHSTAAENKNSKSRKQYSSHPSVYFLFCFFWGAEKKGNDERPLNNFVVDSIYFLFKELIASPNAGLVGLPPQKRPQMHWVGRPLLCKRKFK